MTALNIKQEQSTVPVNEPILDIDDLAGELRIKKSWLYSQTRLKGADTIPVVRVGKYLRFFKSQVLEWLQRTGGRDGQ
jgi:hypothetical protein